MEIRLGNLIESQGALGILNQQRGLSSVTAYRIMKNVKAVTEEFKAYDEQRIALCKEYANKDEKENPIIRPDGNYDIPEESMREYLEELRKLHDEVVEIPIKKVALKEIDAAGLSPVLIEAIEFMLETDEE